MQKFTDQEIFTIVYRHLLAQGVQAGIITTADDGEKTFNCKYRGDNNTKCAIGCLIPDDVYTLFMEKLGISNLINYGYALPFSEENDLGLLEQLQFIHDDDPVSLWRVNLTALAAVYSLEIPTCP